MIVVEQIKLPVSHGKEDLEKEIYKRLGLELTEKLDYQIIKRSVDARKKPDIFFVYSIAVTSEIRLKKYDKRHVRISDKKEPYNFPEVYTGEISETKRPVIVGFGPAGIFAAYMLAKAGFCPVVLERGRDADTRKADVAHFWETGELSEESNVSFGEGGAGTFSDGKLNTGIGSAQGRSDAILNIFVRHGAPERILVDNKPHLGTDILTDIVKSMRKEIIKCGGKVIFGAKYKSFISEGGVVAGCIYEDTTTGDERVLKTGNICLCIGHSARDTFHMLNEQRIAMSQKDFAVGFRVAHPQSIIDEYMYGAGFAREKTGSILPVADYKLTGQTSDKRGVYSFCMCPGGFVVNASTEKGGTVVNGMSYSDRGGKYANSAIVVTVSGKDFGDGLFAGMDFQKTLEQAAYRAGKGAIPTQYYGDFKNGTLTREPENADLFAKGRTKPADLNMILPGYISGAIKEVMPYFATRIKGFDSDDVLCMGVESRTSSPVRIMRDEGFMSNVPGIFPCGEGAGYAGGITSAAVDGIRVAEAVAKRMVNRI